MLRYPIPGTDTWTPSLCVPVRMTYHLGHINLYFPIPLATKPFETSLKPLAPAARFVLHLW